MNNSSAHAPLPVKRFAHLAMVGSWMIWSFDPVLIRMIGNETPRLIVTSCSALIGGMLFLFPALREFRTVLRDRRLLLMFAFYIIFCTALADFCYIMAIRHMTPGMVALVLRSQIALTVLAAWWFFAERITLPVGAGVLIILGAHATGVVTSCRQSADPLLANTTPLGWFMTFAAAILWTGATITGKKLLNHVSPSALCGLRLLNAGLLALSASLVVDGLAAFGGLSLRQWLLIAAKGVLGSCIAYGLHLYGLKYVKVTVAAAIEQTAPLFTITMSWFLLQEKISFFQMLTAAVVLAGAMVIIIARNRERPVAA